MASRVDNVMEGFRNVPYLRTSKMTAEYTIDAVLPDHGLVPALRGNSTQPLSSTLLHGGLCSSWLRSFTHIVQSCHIWLKRVTPATTWKKATGPGAREPSSQIYAPSGSSCTPHTAHLDPTYLRK